MLKATHKNEGIMYYECQHFFINYLMKKKQNNPNNTDHMNFMLKLTNNICFISWRLDVFECHDRGQTEISLEQVCEGTEDCKRGGDESVWACAEKNGW